MLKYTTAHFVPQYTPKLDRKVELKELTNSEKTKALIKEIEASTLSEEEKEFLKQGAQRHLKFNYGLIAEYYCTASKEMQELMEKSALVIIDVNDAINNGYLKLTKAVENILNNTPEEVESNGEE